MPNDTETPASDPTAAFRSAAGQFDRCLVALEKMADHAERGGEVSNVAALEAIAALPESLDAMEYTADFLGPEAESLRPGLKRMKHLTQEIFAAVTSKSGCVPPPDLARPVPIPDSDGNDVLHQDPRGIAPDWRKHWSLDASWCLDVLPAIAKVLREPSNKEHLTQWRAGVQDWEAQRTETNAHATSEKPNRSGHQDEVALRALLRVYTNGLADERIKKAAPLVRDPGLSVNEKLTKIDALMPFPGTASAEQLGELLGVTKQAVLKTEWWTEKRRGEKEDETGRRRAVHQKRAKEYERPSANDDDE